MRKKKRKLNEIEHLRNNIIVEVIFYFYLFIYLPHYNNYKKMPKK